MQEHQLLQARHSVPSASSHDFIKLSGDELRRELFIVNFAVTFAVQTGNKLVYLFAREAKSELPDSIPELYLG